MYARSLPVLPFLIVFIVSLSFGQNGQGADVRSDSERKSIVADVIKSAPIIDGHSDLFAWYFGCDYKKLAKCPQDIADYPIDSIRKGQTDIPRWRKGGVGGVQLNVAADSLSSFLDAYDLLYRLEKTYGKDLKVVGSAAEMRQAMKSGKIVLLPMLEGSERLENKPSMLRTFYRLGLRTMTFTYVTGELGDAADDKPKHNGITALGREMVREMNRLGMIVDMSHVSAKSMGDILDITSAPVIFSHSNAKAICDVERNVPDDILLRLKANGGLIMLDMVPDHTTNEFAKWYRDGDVIYYQTKEKFPGDKEKLNSAMAEWEKANPRPVVTIGDVANHFDHVKKKIGVDHIGIGGDFDGLDFTIEGLEDVSTYPALLNELIRRGWSASELKKITSGNFLRVFEEVEKRSTAR